MTAEVSLSFIEKPVNEKPNFSDDRVGDMTGKPEFPDMPYSQKQKLNLHS